MSAQYTKLQNDRDFRVLRMFDRKTDQSKLYCELRTQNSDSLNPPYAALSYTWSSPLAEPDAIQLYDNSKEDNLVAIDLRCDDGPVWEHRISRNLYEALQDIHRTHWSYDLWVDAVCINQEDLTERNAQVKLMGCLYSGAERVLCWIGAADEATEDILWLHGPFVDFLTESKAKIGGYPYPDMSSARRLAKQSRKLSADSCLEFHGTSFKISVKHLLTLLDYFEKRNYFRRVWMVQEIALGRRVIMIHGKNEISISGSNELRDWLVLNAALIAGILQRDVRPVCHRNIITLSTQLREERDLCIRKDSGPLNLPQRVWGADSLRTSAFAWLEFLLLWSQCFEATRRHDYIYGIGGLISYLDPRYDGIISLEPRYDLPFEHVCIELTKQLLNELPFMLTFSLLTSPSRRNFPKLPSWVPDLSIANDLGNFGGFRFLGFDHFEILVDAYPMRHGTDCTLEFDASVLRLYGRRCGRIVQLIDPSKITLNVDENKTPMSMHALNLGRLFVKFLELAQELDPIYIPHPEQCGLDAVLWAAVHCARERTLTFSTESLRSGFVNQLKLSILRGLKTFVYSTDDMHLTEQADEILTSLRRLLTFFDGRYNLPQPSDIEIFMGRKSAPLEELTSAVQFEGMLSNSLTGHELFLSYPAASKMASAEDDAQRNKHCTARHRYIGLCPMEVQPDDELWILCKAAVPQILRPIGSSDGTTSGRYQILGEAYVQGGMWGELVHNGSAEPVEMITLC